MPVRSRRPLVAATCYTISRVTSDGRGGLPTYASKSDNVTSELRSLIQQGELRPGAVLRQRELAARFAVSPTPVREALRRLEAEGYVATELHREATVVGADATQRRENFLIMANLESLAAGLAAEKVTDDDLVEIGSLHDQLAGLSDGDRALADLNRRFHFRIYECARSPVLTLLLTLLWRSATAQLPPVMRPHHDTVHQHGLILGALRERSTEAAADHTRRHIMDAAMVRGLPT
jgi:DNA-binding GntR family transcriptional regulator